MKNDYSEKIKMYNESTETRPIPGRQHSKKSVTLPFKF
jgi:hypothetical protein